jgi:hypothetical protein
MPGTGEEVDFGIRKCRNMSLNRANRARGKNGKVAVFGNPLHFSQRVGCQDLGGSGGGASPQGVS